MVTKLQKWGNSLGLRIPKSFAAEIRVEAGSIVDIRVESGALVVRPVRRRKYHVTQLVRGVTSRNLHEEITTGKAVGRESW